MPAPFGTFAAAVTILVTALLTVTPAASATMQVRLGASTTEGPTRLVIDQSGSSSPSSVVVDLANDGAWRFTFGDASTPDVGAATALHASVTSMCTTSDLDVDGVADTATCDAAAAGGVDHTLAPLIYLGDGATTSSTITGPASRGVWLAGELGNDVLRGGAGRDIVDGGGGADEVSGQGGADVVIGGPGIDTAYGDDTFNNGTGADRLELRDGAADFGFCGGGADTVVLDAVSVEADFRFFACETRQRPVPTTTIDGIAWPTTAVTNQARRVAFPNLVGRQVTQGSELLRRLEIEVDDARSTMHFATGTTAQITRGYGRDPFDGVWRAGDVLSVATFRPGAMVLTGPTGRTSLDYTVYLGPSKDNCLEETAMFAGMPFDQFRAAAEDLGCRIDDVTVNFSPPRTPGEEDTFSGDRCEVGARAAAGGRMLDATLAVPANPAQHDLRIAITPLAQPGGVLTVGEDGSLPASPYPAQFNGAFEVRVYDRGFQHLKNVSVYVDATGVGGGTHAGRTGTLVLRSPANNTVTVGTHHNAFAVTGFRPARAGIVEIAAFVTGKNGKSVCGAIKVPTKLLTRQVNAVYTAANGARFQFRNTAAAGQPTAFRWVRIAASTGSSAQRGAGDRSLASFLQAILRALGFAVGAGQPNSAAVAGTQAEFMGVNRAIGTGMTPTKISSRLGSLTYVTVTGGSSRVAVGRIVSNHTSGLIANDGASIISNDGGGIISNDGGGIISNDGGSISYAIDRNGQLITASDHGLGSPLRASGPVVNATAANVIPAGGVAIIANDGTSVTGAGPNGLMSNHGGGFRIP